MVQLQHSYAEFFYKNFMNKIKEQQSVFFSSSIKIYDGLLVPTMIMMWNYIWRTITVWFIFKYALPLQRLHTLLLTSTSTCPDHYS